MLFKQSLALSIGLSSELLFPKGIGCRVSTTKCRTCCCLPVGPHSTLLRRNQRPRAALDKHPSHTLTAAFMSRSVFQHGLSQRRGETKSLSALTILNPMSSDTYTQSRSPLSNHDHRFRLRTRSLNPSLNPSSCSPSSNCLTCNPLLGPKTQRRARFATRGTRRVADLQKTALKL